MYTYETQYMIQFWNAIFTENSQDDNSTYSHSNYSCTILSKGKGAMRITLCEAPTRKTMSPDHNTPNYVTYSLRY